MDRLHLMRAFVASADAGSFSAAADRVGLTNKGVSKYVAALEDALGVRLFHRTTRRLGLTDAGHRYLEGAREILERIEALEGGLGSDQGVVRGRLRVSAPVNFGELYMGEVVAAFCGLHPEVEVDLRLSDRYVDLAEDGIDLALRIGTLRDSSLLARRIARTHLWVVASSAFLNAHGRPETPEGLAGLPAIHDGNLRSGPAWPFVTDGQTRRIGIAARITVDSARTASALAAGGMGVTLCPDYVVAPMVADGRLERVLTDHASLSLDIHLVYPSGRHLPAKTRVMIDYLVRRFCNQVGWTETGGPDAKRSDGA